MPRAGITTSNAEPWPEGTALDPTAPHLDRDNPALAPIPPHSADMGRRWIQFRVTGLRQGRRWIQFRGGANLRQSGGSPGKTTEFGSPAVTNTIGVSAGFGKESLGVV